MISAGLTGSIATGKSEVAKLFSIAGIPVFNSDAAVHDLYAEKTTTDLLGKAFPEVIVGGKIDRQRLGQRVLGSPGDLKKLESLIHPLVRKRWKDFIAHWQKQNSPFVVLDIPLLFETGQDKEVNYIIVVSASEDVQRKRVMARPGMTEDKFAHILARQMPDAEKRRRADFIIENSGSLEHLQTQVDALSKRLGELARNQKP
jgi:dephospho-CoA kinase